MYSRLQDFCSRHRRKLIVAGTFIGGTVLLSKYAQWRLRKWQEKQTVELVAKAQRNQHYEATQRTCNMTILSFVPNIKDAVTKALDADSLTDALKIKPKNKLKVWHELKVVAFSRMVASVYAGTYLVLFIKLQLNHIGAYLLVPGSISQLVREKYVGLLEYFLQSGITDLCDKVRKKTAGVVNDVSLKQKLNLSQVEALFTNIRQSIASEENGVQVKPVISYLVCDSPVELRDNQLQTLVCEMADVMETEDFNQVVSKCLDVGFSAVMDKLAEAYPFSSTNEEFTPLNDVSIPLAKLIPLLNSLVYVLHMETPDLWVHRLILQESVTNFAANVYEAFCQPENV